MPHTMLLTRSEKYDSNPSTAQAADGTVMCVDPAKALTQPRTKPALFLPSAFEDSLCYGELEVGPQMYSLWKTQDIFIV